MMNDFRNFVSRGNVLELAVAVVMRSTFGAIVTSLVNDLFMPAVRLVTLWLNFSNLALRVGDIQIAYGNFLQSVVTFLLVAWVSFWLVRMVKRMQLQLLGAQAAGVDGRGRWGGRGWRKGTGQRCGRGYCIAARNP